MKRFLVLALTLLLFASPTHAWVLGGGGDRYNPVFGGTIALDSGTCLNWNASDMTLCHSADTLTLAGGTLSAPSMSLTATGGDVLTFTGSTGYEIYSAGNLNIYAGSSLYTTAGTTHYLGLGDGTVIITAGLTKFGAPSATPIANTIQGAAGSGANIAGANFTVGGGPSTGSADGGSLILATSPAGGAGSGANALVDRLIIDSTGAIGFLSATAERLRIHYTAGSGLTDNVNPAQIGINSTGDLLISPRTNNPSGVILYSNAGTAAVERLRISSDGTTTLTKPVITPGSGTGVTVANAGSLERLVYKVTVTYAALSADALTADKTIATIPAKQRLVGVIADTTTVYSGGAVSAATLMVGKSVGGAEYLAVHDVKTSVVTKGLADADLGTSMTRAAAIQGGDLPSWSTTTDVSVRLTTVDANTSACTQGSTTYYLITELMP